MQRFKQSALAATAVALVAIAVGACGSGGSNSSSSKGSSAVTEISGLKQVGIGLTEPTNPSGAKIKGGTVTWAETPELTPNYIFPMTSFAVCSQANTSQFSALLYRPLYWYGNNYSPTVNYNYSVAKAPVFSDNNTVVTVTLNSWKWSDGEPVTSRDIEFWMNLYKANPNNYCGYVPGRFPDNVTSMSTPNASTIVFHLNRSYNPEWFLYNELSQITPLPLAWDRTSLTKPAPTTDDGKLPDTTKAGALKVFKFLDTQSKDLGTWASSPVWSVVDGPWKLTQFTSDGAATFVPNPTYSGSPKPAISKFVELPYTSDTAAFNEFRSGGPSAVTIGFLPPQDVPQVPAIEAAGYTDNKASSYSFNYFPLNFNNPTVGPIFQQLYFRQAFQHLIDQPGWIKAFLDDAAVQTTNPVPPAPPSPLIKISAANNPLVFSIADARKLLTSNGWKVVGGGTTTCVKPGTAAGDCGAGITSGEAITFNLDYASGTASLESEMNDLEAQAKKVGITLQLTSHPFDTVIGAGVPCTPTQSICKWTAENWGAGWIYSPDFLPTGESLFATGAASNANGYSNPAANQLIDQTVFAPTRVVETKALTAYAKLMSTQVPVVYGPTQVGIYGGVAGTLVSNKLGGFDAQAFGYLNPEAWYLTK
jgi:peptide/nickel transport system substrate-binding protein